MTRIANFTSIRDEGFVPALNENLRDLHRRIERQASRVERLEAKTADVLGVTTEVKHNLKVVPVQVTVELSRDMRVWFTKAHTETSVFIQGSSANAPLVVVVRS